MKRLITCAAIVLMITGCKKAEEKGAQPDILSKKVLARVDGDPIYEGDVIRRIKVASGAVDRSEMNPNQWQRMVEGALESEIIDRLLLKAATREELVASTEDVDFLINRSKTMLGEENFQEMLKKRDSTEEEYRKFMESRSLIRQYKEKLFGGISIDDETLEQYYEGHTQSFTTPEQVRLEVLVVENTDDADEIYQKVKAGDDFEKVSKEYSDAGKGIVLRRTQLMPSDAVPLALQLKVNAGSAGDIIEPAKIEEKMNIVKIIEKKPAQVLTYEEAKEGIRDLIVKRKQQKALDDWAESAKQDVRIEYIK